MQAHWIYTMMRFFPYWSFPVILVLAELGWIFHRKGKPVRWLFWGICFLLTGSLVAWFYTGAYRNSDRVVRQVLEGR